MATRTKKIREFTAPANDVLAGDRVRQAADDDWAEVERIQTGTALIGDTRIDTVTLVYRVDGAEAWIQQSATEPIEIQRAIDPAPSEGAAD